MGHLKKIVTASLLAAIAAPMVRAGEIADERREIRRDRAELSHDARARRRHHRPHHPRGGGSTA